MRYVSYRRMYVILSRSCYIVIRNVEYLRVSGSLKSSCSCLRNEQGTCGKYVHHNSVRIFIGELNLGDAASRESWLVTFRVRSVCHLGHVTRTANSVQSEAKASGHFSLVTWCWYEQATYVRSKKGRHLTPQGLTCVDVGPWCFPGLKKTRGSLC
jgi:hypothetical protein